VSSAKLQISTSWCAQKVVRKTEEKKRETTA